MNLFPTACLVDAEASLVDSLMPGNQAKTIGSRLQVVEQRTLHIQRVVVAADATGALAFLAEVAGEIVDAWAVCTTANASGTLTLRTATNGITSAIVCAVQHVVSRTTQVVQTYKTITQNQALNVIANGAADRGILYFAVLRA